MNKSIRLKHTSNNANLNKTSRKNNSIFSFRNEESENPKVGFNELLGHVMPSQDDQDNYSKNNDGVSANILIKPNDGLSCISNFRKRSFTQNKITPPNDNYLTCSYKIDLIL
jgi:hypothetical protein